MSDRISALARIDKALRELESINSDLLEALEKRVILCSQLALDTQCCLEEKDDE